MITGPPQSLTVRARQKLKTGQQAEAFNNQLQTTIQKYLEANQTVAFEDFDISQNPLSYENFDVLFSTLSATNVRVERIRLFGCATLDDSVASLVAQWLASVQPDTCPYEVHLSDCAITTAGFTELMDAVESNEAYPFQEPRKTVKIPMYMRLENNYIEEPSMQEKVDQGVIATFKKSDGAIRSPVPSVPDAKVKMLLRTEGKYQQKAGTPPAPEDAPPPKPVWDRSSEEQQWGQQQQSWGNSWGKGGWQPRPQAAGSWQQPQRPAVQATKGVVKGGPAKPGIAVRPASVGARPGYSGATVGKGAAATGKAAVGGKPAAAATGKNGKGAAAAAAVATTAKGKGNLKGSAGSAADRSRTPPPKPAGLPPGWEEHFSDEYGIPYFWNAETSESSWERPTA